MDGRYSPPALAKLMHSTVYGRFVLSHLRLFISFCLNLIVCQSSVQYVCDVRPCFLSIAFLLTSPLGLSVVSPIPLPISLLVFPWFRHPIPAHSFTPRPGVAPFAPPLYSFPIINSGLNELQSHAATWPEGITILVARENVVSPQEFQKWALQNNGILCMVTKPQPHTNDPFTLNLRG